MGVPGDNGGELGTYCIKEIVHNVEIIVNPIKCPIKPWERAWRVPASRPVVSASASFLFAP